MKRVLAVLGVLLFLAAGQASANIVFTFSGVTFDGGGTLTGSFTTNDALTALVDYNITTSPAVGIGFNYTPGNSDSSSTSLPSILVLNTPPALDHILEITFSGGLTTSGAGILLGNNDSFEQGTGGARRVINAGSVTVATSVPEPSSVALVGIAVLALALVIYLRRRKRD